MRLTSVGRVVRAAVGSDSRRNARRASQTVSRAGASVVVGLLVVCCACRRSAKDAVWEPGTEGPPPSLVWLREPIGTVLLWNSHNPVARKGEGAWFRVGAPWHGEDGSSGAADVFWYRDEKHWLALVLDSTGAGWHSYTERIDIRDIEGDRFWLFAAGDPADPRVVRAAWWLGVHPRSWWLRIAAHDK
jgi:hypothetical protein